MSAGELSASALNYAFIHGQGRSGTNFLLGLINQSPASHCRNEPDQLKDSALGRLEPFRFFVDRPDNLAALYDAAIVDTAALTGPRDHGVHWSKAWIYPGMRAPGFFYIYRNYRWMHKLVYRTKPMDGRERTFPFWMSSSRRLRGAAHVFKVNAFVGVARWSLRNRPDAKTLHIVRHPGGFAKSWYRRWAQGKTEQRTSDLKVGWNPLSRLEALIEREESWARRIGDPGGLTAVERELWWWRFCTEETAAAGAGQDNYRRILFEELAEETVPRTREIFEFLGLPWNPGVEARVSEVGRGSAKIAGAWRDELEPEVVEVVERVTADSPALTWWS
ncbi:MAG: hypothetical protein ACI8QS_002348 [Planctomycetota bacterium]